MNATKAQDMFQSHVRGILGSSHSSTGIGAREKVSIERAKTHCSLP